MSSFHRDDNVLSLFAEFLDGKLRRCFLSVALISRMSEGGSHGIAPHPPPIETEFTSEKLITFSESVRWFNSGSCTIIGIEREYFQFYLITCLLCVDLYYINSISIV